MKVHNLRHVRKSHNPIGTTVGAIASLAMLLGIPMASTGVASAETIGGATTQGQPAKPQQSAVSQQSAKPQQVTKLQQSTVPQQPAIPQARPGIGTRAATCTPVSGTPNKHFGFTWHISQDGDECVLHATNLQSITSNRPSSFSSAIADASGDYNSVTKFVADSPLPAISMNFDNLFNFMPALKTIDLTNFANVKPTSMRAMFSDDYALTSLDLTSLDTSNVTNMRDIFTMDTALTDIDLSLTDTSNVTDMANMFLADSSLTSLDLIGFDTSNVTDMTAMFNGDSKLADITFGTTFDTGNVTDMNGMFASDRALTSLDIGGFDTSNVTDMNSMFANTVSLTSLDIGGFDTSNVTDMNNIFVNTPKLNDVTVGADTRVSPINAVGATGQANLDWQAVDQSGNWTGTWSGPFQDIFDASKTPRTETTEYRSAPRYTLSFTAGQGTGSVNPIGRLHEGDKPTLPGSTGMTAPNGERFAGWKDGNTVYQAGDTYTMPNHDVTLNAIWTRDTHTVHFDANDGTGTMPDMTGQITGDSITLPANSLVRTGYDFIGWNTAADGTGSAYQDKANLTMPDSDLTLYAQWHQQQSPTPGTPASTTTPGSKPTAPSNAPTGTTSGTAKKANDTLSNTGSTALAPLCMLTLCALSGITVLALRRKKATGKRL